MKKRIRAVAGGTSASKTVSILLVLIDAAQRDKTPTVTSVVSESFPHLRRGAIKDFISIMEAHNYFKDERWSKTDFTYTFETGSKIEFFSVDQPGKVRGPRRERLFINEANNVPYEAFDQLEVRTKEYVYLDWNPVSEFFFYTDILGKRDDVEFITLTYKDNEALSPDIVRSIEQRKGNKAWWKTYGLGQLGEVESMIYTGWKIIDELPHEARLERRGIDFGYTNDPTAIIDIYKYNDGFILDELLYQNGWSNRQIAEFLKEQPRVLTYADSAEPKSIDELKTYGLPVVGATKGPGSVRQGIQFIQDQRISVTKRSLNLIKSYRNYLWKTDRDGKILNEPDHAFSDCFAPETRIRTTKGYKRIVDLVGKSGYLISRDGLIKRFHDVRPTRKDVETVIVGFEDGSSIELTPNHLLLQHDGTWKEVGLLAGGERIQSDTYDRNPLRDQAKVLRRRLHEISWPQILRRILARTKALSSPGRLGGIQWFNTAGPSHPSQGPRPEQQRIKQPATQAQERSPKGTSDTGETRQSAGVGRKDTSTYEEMAWVRRGEGVAQATWTESVCEKKSHREVLRSLPYEILNKTIRNIRTFLLGKLQDERPTKTVARITRGFQARTYNLEVRDTHCAVAEGVVAHNCMDSARYGFSGMAQVKKQNEEKRRTAPQKPYFRRNFSNQPVQN